MLVCVCVCAGECVCMCVISARALHMHQRFLHVLAWLAAEGFASQHRYQTGMFEAGVTLKVNVSLLCVRVFVALHFGRCVKQHMAQCVV